MSMAINDPLDGPAQAEGAAPQGREQIDATRASTTEPALDSRSLLQGGKAVAIRHNGELYRLQATRQGKLILTK